MNFKFYIFGTPKIFDLYHGNVEDLNYFQQFYDEGNRENTKFTIHRKANGQVSYIFLKHNFLTAEDRKNSFLGLAVVFNNEYVVDVENLQKLFAAVYETILNNKVLLEEVKGNPNVQAKFLVRSFAEAENEVQRIESVISKNLTEQFADDVRLIDASFKNSGNGYKFNKAENDKIEKALQECQWIHISFDYKDAPAPTKEELNQLDKIVKIADIEKAINPLSVEIAKKALQSENLQSEKDQISSFIKSIIGGLEWITKWLINNYTNPNESLLNNEDQPELNERYRKYIAIVKQLEDLGKAVSIQSPTPLPQQLDGSGGAAQSKIAGTSPNPTSKDKTKGDKKCDFEKFLKKILSRIKISIEKTNSTQGTTPPTITFKGKKYTDIDELLNVLKNEPTENKNIIIEGCNKVIEYPESTLEQKKKAEELKTKISDGVVPKNPFFGKIEKLIKYIFLIASFLCILFLVWKFSFERKRFPDTKKYNKLVSLGDSCMKEEPKSLDNIDMAITKYKEADTLEVEQNEAKDKIEKANGAAITLLKYSANTEFHKTETHNQPKIGCYHETVKLIEKAGINYAYKDVKTDTLAYRDTTIKYYEAEIEKSEVSKDQKERYAEIITGELGDKGNTVVQRFLSSQNEQEQQYKKSKKIDITITDAQGSKILNDTVSYNGNSVTFRAKVSSGIGVGEWTASEGVSITHPKNADTEIKIENPDDEVEYTITFKVGAKTATKTIKTKKKASRR
jgi:hypothetical protein